MNDLSDLETLCKIALSGEASSIRDLTEYIDELVSSDRVYDFDENLQNRILSFQVDLASFDSVHPNMPDYGFLNLDQIMRSIRLFLEFRGYDT